MKFIFWTNSWDGGAEYLEKNTSLQDISQKHDFYFMNSGDKSEQIIKNLYNGKCINCENDKAIKGKVLFEELKDVSYDVLIRIDLDAIIFDLDRLLLKIENSITEDKLCVLGNTKRFVGRKQGNKKYRGIEYVRGACNAASKNVIDKINMITEEKAGFDIPYAMSFHKMNCKLVSCKLFELNNKYTGKYPVWHPKGKGTAKLRAFLKEIEKYGQA